jgi:hypothetical protein
LPVETWVPNPPWSSSTSAAGRDLGAEPALVKQYERRVPAALPTAAEVVKALSQGLEELAREIAADADALPLPPAEKS